jgi:hypothetical protein
MAEIVGFFIEKGFGGVFVNVELFEEESLGCYIAVFFDHCFMKSCFLRSLFYEKLFLAAFILKSL